MMTSEAKKVIIEALQRYSNSSLSNGDMTLSEECQFLSNVFVEFEIALYPKASSIKADLN